MEGLPDARAHDQVLAVQRHVRRVRGFKDQRAKVGRGVAVRRARSGAREVGAVGAEGNRQRAQLRQDQKVRVQRMHVQAVEGEQVRAGLEQSLEGGDVNVLPGVHVRVGAVRRGHGVPSERILEINGVARRHLHAVQVGHETVVVTHAQREEIDGRGVRHFKGNPQVGH